MGSIPTMVGFYIRQKPLYTSLWGIIYVRPNIEHEVGVEYKLVYPIIVGITQVFSYVCSLV